jgi:hypothetical protein
MLLGDAAGGLAVAPDADSSDNVLLGDAAGLAVAPDAADKDGMHELCHDDGVALEEMALTMTISFLEMLLRG